jgi:hypothetical protein
MLSDRMIAKTYRIISAVRPKARRLVLIRDWGASIGTMLQSARQLTMDFSTGCAVMTELAADKIRSCLARADKPKGIALFDSVASYFGPSLSIWQQAIKEDYSGFTPKIGGTRVLFEMALHLDAAAIVHECLHAKLRMDGYPIAHDGAWHSLLAILTVSNLLDHEIFMSEFLAIGFSRSQLVVDAMKREDFDSIWASNFQTRRQDAEWAPYLRGYWLTNYLAEWLDGKKRLPSGAAAVRRIGVANFPDFDQDVEWISNWFYHGEFRDSKKYGESINDFLKRAGLEPIKFSHIKKVGGHFELEA